MMQEHPFMIDKKGEPMVVCADAEIPAELGGVERMLELALSPALEALKPLHDVNYSVPPICVLVALPEERPGRPENLESVFGQQFGLRLSEKIKLQNLSCYALGHAGGLVCMEHAVSFIESGRSQLCLVGGVESYHEPETLEWLDSLDQLHSESTIWGFCPGEGGGFCLLASQELADRLGLSVSVKLLSAASAMEANCIKTDTVCIGEGLSEAFRKTLAGLPSENAQVDHTICDLNGEPYRGNEYGFAMLRSAGKFGEEADFETPADCWGDVGAASGPLFAILAAFAAKKAYAPGPLTFLWASSEGGQRAAALLQSTDFASKVLI
jgi:3-oxoacyl-[acyl-carrier-protein] synthase-1